jgi:hypothetical protein
MKSNLEARTAAAGAWQRLWTVGANGENINNRNTNDQKKRKNNNNDNMNTDFPNPRRRQSQQTKRKATQNEDNTKTRTVRTNQINLNGINIDLADVEEYGDIMERKPEKVLRVMFQNINRLPIKKNSIKSKKLVSFIANKQIDAPC